MQKLCHHSARGGCDIYFSAIVLSFHHVLLKIFFCSEQNRIDVLLLARAGQLGWFHHDNVVTGWSRNKGSGEMTMMLTPALAVRRLEGQASFPKQRRKLDDLCAF